MSSITRIFAEIFLKDNLSKGLKEASDNVDDFAKKSGKNLKDLTVKTDKYFVQLKDSLMEASQKMAMAGAGLTAGLTLPIAALAKTSTEAAAQMQGFRAGLKAITGSSETASKTLVDLEGMARRTATSYDLLVRASSGLIAGFDGDVKGANAVLERFATLSSVLNVSSTDFDRMVTNLIQVGGQSRLTGDELREMASIFPNLRVLLKDAFNTNSSEELAKLGITGRQALEGIARAIDARGFKADTTTFNAQLQQMQTEFFKLKAVAGEIFMPIAQSIMTNLIPALKSLGESLKNLDPLTKNLALGLLGIGAAIGPIMVALGGLGASFSAIIGAGSNLTKMLGVIRTSFLAVGGAAGIMEGAIAILTGPIGWIAAALAVMYLAWKNNFGGIQNVVLPVVNKVSQMFRDMWANVTGTLSDLMDDMRLLWAELQPIVQPVLDAVYFYFNLTFANIFNSIQKAFQFIIDVVNVGMAGIKLLMGKGMDDMSASMKASLARLTSLFWSAMAIVANAVLSSFKVLMSFTKLIPGVSGVYDNLVKSAEGRIAQMEFESRVTEELAGRYDSIADAQRKVRDEMKKISSVSGDSAGSLSSSPGKGGKAAQKASGGDKKGIKEIRDGWEEVYKLQNQLLSQKMRMRGEDLLNVLAVQEYGKLYKDIEKDYNRARITAMKNLELFDKEQDAINATKDALKAKADAYTALNQSVMDAALNYQKEREQIDMTTRFEKARWEITKGGYKDANFFAKAFYLSQALLMDQAEKSRDIQKKWADFWDGIKKKVEDFNENQRKGATEKYDEYIKRLTQRLLELGGAQEMILRNNLTEQFSGLTKGLKGPELEKAKERVRKMVEEIMGMNKEVSKAEAYVKMLQNLANGIERIFEKALGDLLDGGFKNFFTSVVEGFRGMIRQVAIEFLKLQMMKALVWGVGQLFGSTAGTDFKNSIQARANGGSVYNGQPYLVGERGPELFIPSGGGRIINNSSTEKVMSNQSSIIVNISTPNPQAFRKSEAQMIAEVFGRANRARMRTSG